MAEALFAFRETAPNLDYVSENTLAETPDLLGVLGNDWVDGRQLALRVDGRVAKIELTRSI